jgi:hypothetical protein
MRLNAIGGLASFSQNIAISGELTIAFPQCRGLDIWREGFAEVPNLEHHSADDK